MAGRKKHDDGVEYARLTVRLPMSLKLATEQAAFQDGRSVSVWVERLITAAISEAGKGKS